MSAQTPGGLALVARLAAAFPDDKDPFTPALQWLWENAQDLRVRAALAVALTRRGEEHDYADDILTDLFSDLHRPPDNYGD